MAMMMMGMESEVCRGKVCGAAVAEHNNTELRVKITEATLGPAATPRHADVRHLQSGRQHRAEMTPKAERIKKPPDYKVTVLVFCLRAGSEEM